MAVASTGDSHTCEQTRRRIEHWVRPAPTRPSRAFAQHPVVALVTERGRREADNTLWHGARVIDALTRAVHLLADSTDAVVAKGGITSDQVARVGIGADSGRVRGQIAAGVSVWDLDRPGGGTMPYVVVPGNVGGGDALTDALDAIGA